MTRSAEKRSDKPAQLLNKVRTSNYWFINRKLTIKPNQSKAANRIVAICSPIKTMCQQEALVIY